MVCENQHGELYCWNYSFDEEESIQEDNVQVFGHIRPIQTGEICWQRAQALSVVPEYMIYIGLNGVITAH